MYKLKIEKEKELELYEFTHSKGENWLTVVPERGGIITSFGVEGEELFFLNKDTLYNQEKNIRGGNPILFPISGQLEQGKYEWNGQVYSMKNHGVARNNPWEVIGTVMDETKAEISIRMISNEETRKEYPFDFELIFTYTLTENMLTIDQQYRNTSQAEMPIYAGFHPYFKTNVKNLTYHTDAAAYLDYNDMEKKSIQGSIDLSNKKESLVLLDAAEKEISFDLPDRNKSITLTYGDEFKYVVLWTEQDQPFICVEPWMAKTDELNRKEELVMVKPGETLQTKFSIAAK